MKILNLQRGLKAFIDDKDFDRVSQYKWTATQFANYKNKDKYYVQSTGCYLDLGFMLLHRFIMNAPEGTLIDHVDGNPLNNVRSNLRFATPSQNNCNRAAQSNNKFGLKGVSFHKKAGKFRAQIQINGKRKHIGHFNTPELAAIAYDSAAKKFYGEFAWLNYGK